MRIHAIQTGTVAVKQRQAEGVGSGSLRLLATMADRRWTEPLPILAWVIEHAEGLIVVDTGETARATQQGYFTAWNPYFRLGVREWQAPEDELGPQLRRLGFSADDVRWTVMTHLHTDHAGGLGHLRRSRVLVSPVELRQATGLAGKARGYLPQHLPAWLDPEPIVFTDRPFGPFATSAPVTADGAVTVLPTPGHTPGHVSIAVEMPEGLVVLAGDASYSQELMLAGRADGVTRDAPTARRTLGLLHELARQRPTVYLPSHDPGSAARLATMEPAPAGG